MDSKGSRDGRRHHQHAALQGSDAACVENLPAAEHAPVGNNLISLTSIAAALLVPAFESRGFKHFPSAKGKADDVDGALSLPIGVFRRESHDGMDVVEPHFHEKNKLSINAGRIPLSGLTTRLGHFPAEDCLITWGDCWFEFYACPALRIPFAARGLWWRKPVVQDFIEVVETVIGLIPEIELALEQGVVSRHVRRVRIKR